jgi:pheromone shutdown protein TraB
VAGRRGSRHILAVVGVGHLRGIEAALAGSGEDPDRTLRELERSPPPSRLPRIWGSALLALILGGFAYGFAQSPQLGLDLIWDWVRITGGLCALGTAIAGAHPLTVAAAFLAAPLTTLHPAIGAGMVTGALELALRRPSLGDFARLREDVASLGGWWRNRVARVLLVALLSTLGAALGTYGAGAVIAGRLMGQP